MRDLVILLVHVITIILRLVRQGGVRPSWRNLFLSNINY
jgi:hypothetical protein